MATYSGSGVFNSLISKLPFEIHLPGYQYCGPGTKLKKRLSRGDPGINGLDAACKEHDIAYSNNQDLSARHIADKQLEEAAWKRVKARDSKFGEKASAWTVATAMKIKRKLGMGINKKRQIPKTKVSLSGGVIKKTRQSLKGLKKSKFDKSDGLSESINLALSNAKAAVKDAGGRAKVRTPRILPVPKRGGFIPLIPLFAGLSALGALSGGAAGVAKAVNDASAARKKLEEMQRHNEKMEAIAIGKKGGGLYLKPYRKGLGLYISKSKNL